MTFFRLDRHNTKAKQDTGELSPPNKKDFFFEKARILTCTSNKMVVVGNKGKRAQGCLAYGGRTDLEFHVNDVAVNTSN
jgi:hypothetical protein